MMSNTETTIIVLISTNYLEWADTIQSLAKRENIQTYIDPDTITSLSTLPTILALTDFKLTATSLRDLDKDNRDLYIQMESLYHREEARHERLIKDINNIWRAIQKSTTNYQGVTLNTSNPYKALQALKSHLKPTSEVTRQLLHCTYQGLVKSPARAKLDTWTTDWTNFIRSISKHDPTSQNKTNLGRDFLAAGQKWVSSFYDIYTRQELAIKRSKGEPETLSLLNTISEFRKDLILKHFITANIISTTLSSTAFIATL